MPRDLDTASCIYCRLPKKEHWPTCPVRRTEWEKTWEQLKAWVGGATGALNLIFTLLSRLKRAHL
jgi:hypothetical protein